MLIKTTAATTLAIGALFGASVAPASASPPDNGNCLSGFVNGGSQGSNVSGDPGGAQASGDLGHSIGTDEHGCR